MRVAKALEKKVEGKLVGSSLLAPEGGVGLCGDLIRYRRWDQLEARGRME